MARNALFTQKGRKNAKNIHICIEISMWKGLMKYVKTMKYAPLFLMFSSIKKKN